MFRFIPFVASALLISLAAMPLSAKTAEIGDSSFDERYRIAETELELKGVGLLKYLGFIKAYSGAFV